MIKIWFIGDCHNRINDYFALINQLNIDCSIQLGDLGMGFPNCRWPEKWDLSHRFLFGNHCNTKRVLSHPNCLGKFGYLPNPNIYFISGAFSIDYRQRIEGLTWWKNEELSYREFDQILQEVKVYQPRIIVSHDCPDQARDKMFDFKNFYKTRTGQFLQVLFENYQPEIHLFGHYHFSRQAFIGKTHFICLQELECCEIPDVRF